MYLSSYTFHAMKTILSAFHVFRNYLLYSCFSRHTLCLSSPLSRIYSPCTSGPPAPASTRYYHCICSNNTMFGACVNYLSCYEEVHNNLKN